MPISKESRAATCRNTHGACQDGDPNAERMKGRCRELNDYTQRGLRNHRTSMEKNLTDQRLLIPKARANSLIKCRPTSDFASVCNNRGCGEGQPEVWDPGLFLETQALLVEP